MGAIFEFGNVFWQLEKERNTSWTGLEGRERLVGERDGNFEVVGKGQGLGRPPANSRSAEERHIGNDVPVNHFGVDLVTWHGLCVLHKTTYVRRVVGKDTHNNNDRSAVRLGQSLIDVEAGYLIIQ